MTVDPKVEAILGLRRAGRAVVLVTYRGDWCPYCCAQLVRLSAESDRIHGAGGEVIAISTDDDVRQAGMFDRWPTPHVRYVGDPGGERYLRPLELFDPDERDGIALPAVLVLDPAGEVVYRYVGRDFADRTTDDAVLAALERLSLDAIDPPAGGPVADGPADGPADVDRHFSPADLVPYFTGSRSGAIAIGGRLPDSEGRALAREHRLMCDSTLDAWSRLGS